MSETHSTAQLPLDGIKVVDLTQAVAGPFVSMTLADLGADIQKIESVGKGDLSRNISPSPEYFDTVNRNKESIAINLKDPEGQEIAKSMISDADIFLENMKPGRTEKFGLEYEDVKEANPNIIYCSLNGFGKNSPYEERPAWGEIIQAMSGVMSMTGDEDGPPTWSGAAIGDLVPALNATYAIIAALYARDNDQIESEYLEVPMLDSVVSFLSVRAGYSFGTGEPFPRTGAIHPLWAPFDAYETSDGTILVGPGTEYQWKAFCDAIERPELHSDSRFDTMEKRVENRTELDSIIRPIIKERTTDDWFEIFREYEVPAGPIRDTVSVWDDKHVAQRKLRQKMPRENTADATVIDNPIRFNELKTTLGSPPPELGQDTSDILLEIGYDDETIEDLRDRSIVE